MAYIVRPGSALARTAAELLQRHEDTGADGGAGCAGCGRPAPCPTAMHARQVLAMTPTPHPAAAPVPPMRTAADAVATGLVAAET